MVLSGVAVVVKKPLFLIPFHACVLLADFEYGLINSSLEYVTTFSDRYLMELMEYHMVLYDKLRETVYLFLKFYYRAYHHILKFDSRISNLRSLLFKDLFVLFFI